MERLLVCQLNAAGCHAEALLNGMPVARAGPASGTVVVPVHEYACAGANTLTLVVGGPRASASSPPAGRPVTARLLLPRIGHLIDENNVRTLASVEGPVDETPPVEWPVRRSVEVELPIAFPRWRWLDAPAVPVTPGLQQQLFGWVQGLARDLAGGDPSSFLAATRLRTEELAFAYQRDAAAETERLRGHLQALQAAGRLGWAALEAADFTLRPLAGGRLLECQGADGEPALATAPGPAQPGDGSLAFPLRVAVVDRVPYVLR